MPPSTDPGVVKRPPDNVDPQVIDHPPRKVDPGLVQTPPTDANPAGVEKSADGQRDDARSRENDRAGKASARKKSKQDDCRGRADLCKQDSPR